MFVFHSKKKLQARAEELIIEAKIDADLANKTDYFDTFMEYYDEILLDFEELVQISKQIKLQGVNGDPEYDYYRLKNDQQ